MDRKLLSKPVRAERSCSAADRARLSVDFSGINPGILGVWRIRSVPAGGIFPKTGEIDRIVEVAAVGVPKLHVTDGVEWPRMADPTRSTLDTNPPTHLNSRMNTSSF